MGWVASTYNSMIYQFNWILNMILGIIEWFTNIFMFILNIILLSLPIIIVAVAYIFGGPIVQVLIKTITDIITTIWNFLIDAFKLIYGGLKFILRYLILKPIAFLIKGLILPLSFVIIPFVLKDVVWWSLEFIIQQFIKPFLKVFIKVLRVVMY